MRDEFSERRGLRGGSGGTSEARFVALAGLLVSVNVVLGSAVTGLRLPVYFDTLGTVIAGAVFGPLPGALVGVLTNVATGILTGNLRDIPFCLVSLILGLVAGFACRGKNPSLPRYAALGVALGVICAAVGTPIGILVYGGLNGTASDFLVMALSSEVGFTNAAFARNLVTNTVDKVITCVVACSLIKRLRLLFPGSFRRLANVSVSHDVDTSPVGSDGELEDEDLFDRV